MGAWYSDFISNDNFLDFWDSFNDAAAPVQVHFFNQQLQKALTESLNFRLSDDHLPLEFNENIDTADDFLVDEYQETCEREIFLGLIQQLIDQKQFSLLSKYVLEQSLTFLSQLTHKNLLKHWINPSERFTEIFKLHQMINELLSQLP